MGICLDNLAVGAFTLYVNGKRCATFITMISVLVEHTRVYMEGLGHLAIALLIVFLGGNTVIVCIGGAFANCIVWKASAFW